MYVTAKIMVINNITVKLIYHIERLEDIFDEFHGSLVFYKVDIHNRHHQTRIKEEGEWKATFKINDGFYKWLVMPFVFNDPSTIMRLVNKVMRSFIRNYVVLYFDHILVY